MESSDSLERTGHSNEPVVGLDRKIPFVEKLFFPAIGGILAVFNLIIQLYLMYFYTNKQQLDILYIRLLIPAVPIAAAVLLPVFGAFVDKQATHWGKYRPWIFITLLGAGAGAFLAFIPVNFGQAGNLVYATATYSVFCLCLAAFQSAFIGTTTAMTKKYDDRMTIAAVGAIWNSTGFAIVSYTAMPFAGMFGNRGNLGNGFQYYALICLVAAAVLTLLILRVTKERFVIPAQKQAGFSLGLQVRAFFKNKYAMIAFFCTLLLPLHSIRASFNIYYCQSIFGDTGMMATLVLLSSAPALAGVLISPFVAKKLDIKIILLTAAAVNIVTSAALFFVPPTPFGAIAVYVLTGIESLFIGIAQPVQNAMIPFAADYGEWKYNTSCAGFLGSVNGIAKVLAAVILSTGVLSRLIMPLLGYTPQAEQSAATLIGIKLAVSFIPAAIFVILLLIVLRWDLTREKHGDIVREVYHRSQE